MNRNGSTGDGCAPSDQNTAIVAHRKRLNPACVAIADIPVVPTFPP
jgi:hypothetical protein